MPLDAEKLLNRKFKTIRHTYTEKDCMLYALGVGMGIDPLDEECLRFSALVYPGETIRTEIWRNGNEVAFRCKSLEQDKVVISNGQLLVE